MRIVFAGTPEPAVVALEKLIASRHEMAAVITRPDARRDVAAVCIPVQLRPWPKSTA